MSLNSIKCFQNGNNCCKKCNSSKHNIILMIAESRTEEKDTMVKVVVNLINQDNE